MIEHHIAQKKWSLWKLAFFIVAFQCLLILSGLRIFKGMPLSLIPLAALAALGYAFYLFLTDSMLSFQIKWMDDQLHLERILGKGNHAYLAIEVTEIASMTAYPNGASIPHPRWFCHRDAKAGLYAITLRSGQRYVFQPSAAILGAMKEAMRA